MSDLDALLARADTVAETLLRLGRAMDIGDYDSGDTERDISALLTDLAAAVRDLRQAHDTALAIIRKRAWNLGLTHTEIAAEKAITDAWPRPPGAVLDQTRPTP